MSVNCIQLQRLVPQSIKQCTNLLWDGRGKRNHHHQCKLYKVFIMTLIQLTELQHNLTLILDNDSLGYKGMYILITVQDLCLSCKPLFNSIKQCLSMCQTVCKPLAHWLPQTIHMLKYLEFRPEKRSMSFAYAMCICTPLGLEGTA